MNSENKIIEVFFERKLTGLIEKYDNGAKISKEETFTLNSFDSGKNNFAEFLKSKIEDFHSNKKCNGIFIHCHKGDGISRLSEKLLDISSKILKNHYDPAKYKNTEIEKIITKNELELPITNLIGGKKELLRLIEKTLIKDTFFVRLCKQCAPVFNILLIIGILIGSVVEFFSAFSSMMGNINISLWWVFAITIIAIVINLPAIKKKFNKRKKRDKDLSANDYLEKLNNDATLSKGEYNPLVVPTVKKIATRISQKTKTKIIIIDDIASIDKSGFSKDVLLKCIEETQNDKKVFWIIFSSDRNILINTKSSRTFSQFDLRLLDGEEKNKLRPNQNNDSFNTIKEVLAEQMSDEKTMSLLDELSELKEFSRYYFTFLYLLILNDFPKCFKYKKEKLMGKMFPEGAREKDICINKIFESQPNKEYIKNYFNADEIKKYYQYDEDRDIFNVNNNISRLAGNITDKFNCINNYRYGQGYWALTWYHAYRDTPKIHFVQKISHHLKNLYGEIKKDDGRLIKDDKPEEINDIRVRTKLWEAYLFTAEKSLSYLQNDVVQILDYAINLAPQTLEDFQEERTARLILEVFINFDKVLKFNNAECKKFEEFLEKKEIPLAFSLLKNTDYSSDYIISLLLEQYWERSFFLWMFYESKLPYKPIDEIATEQEELKKEFRDYFDREKDKSSPLYLFNLALYIWVDYIRLLSNDNSIQIEQIMQDINLFLYCYEQTNNPDVLEDDVYQQTNKQESVYLVASVALLLIKKQNAKKEQELKDVLQKIKDIFNEVELDLQNYDESINDIIHFLLLHSLMWRNCDFSIRRSMLSIIRIQLFLFSKGNNNDKNIVKANEILRVSEKIDNKNRLTTLLNFSLSYLNKNLIKGRYKSSFLFQEALDFTGKDKISNIQFEYLYFCIQKHWLLHSKKLNESLKCLVKCSDRYSDQIVKKTHEYPNSYVFICNCLIDFNNDELSLKIDNTGYSLISFFSKILEQAKLKEDEKLENENTEYIWENYSYKRVLPKRKLEDAVCIWENFKFRQLSAKEKQNGRGVFEKFWQNKEDIVFFGQALEILFRLGNVQEDTMRKTYVFLTNEKFDKISWSFILILACRFCNEKKKKNALDSEYDLILYYIKSYEKYWEKSHGHFYENSIYLYATLFNLAQNNYYSDKYYQYENLIKQKKVDNLRITDNVDFFCSLWKIFIEDLSPYNDISSEEKQLFENGKLELIDDENIHVIYDEKISDKYLCLCALTDAESSRRKKLNELAKNNINSLIELIMKTTRNARYFLDIERLRNRLNNATEPSYDED